MNGFGHKSIARRVCIYQTSMDVNFDRLLERKIKAIEFTIGQLTVSINERVLVVGTALRDGMNILNADQEKHFKAHLVLDNKVAENGKKTCRLLESQMLELKSLLKLHKEHSAIIAILDMRVEALEKAGEDFRCVVCFERHRNACLLPCSHGQFCSHCVAELYKNEEDVQCPICRQKVDSFVIVRN